MPIQFPLSRRRLMVAGFGVGASFGTPALLAGAGAQRRRGEQALDYPFPDEPGDLGLALSPTPACESGQAEPTTRQTEGPFYSPDTPLRDVLSEGVDGLPLVVTGRVLTTGCQPIAGAVLDFWQADSRGEYDNRGFTLRGHQFTDAAGAFRLTTIKPSGYGSARFARPPHIHVKAQGPATRLLTTQTYFPGEDPGGDRIFRPELVMAMEEKDGVLHARFDFVLESA